MAVVVEAFEQCQYIFPNNRTLQHNTTLHTLVLLLSATFSLLTSSDLGVFLAEAFFESFFFDDGYGKKKNIGVVRKA